jgi:AcrR family transcriptional regulator
VEIAYRLIADNGLEGFRIRQVAAAASMDNGTLHYYFAGKETLIQSVVEHLMQDLQTNRCDQGNSEDRTALDELRTEFEDIRVRLHESPEQFIVLSELAAQELDRYLSAGGSGIGVAVAALASALGPALSLHRAAKAPTSLAA